MSPHIGVVGSGLMGPGIAEVCARAGHEVDVFDVTAAAAVAAAVASSDRWNGPSAAGRSGRTSALRSRESDAFLTSRSRIWPHRDSPPRPSSAFTANGCNPPPSWHDVAWLAEQWGGPFLVKGITRVDEARRAVDSGATAISASNHGGKSLGV